MSADEDGWGFEQHQGEQLNAGFRAIAANLREFYDLCAEKGFSQVEAFDLTRDTFAYFLERFEPEEDP
jgi:hypothetical protein